MWPRLALSVGFLALAVSDASAASISPPMLDINRQCSAHAKRNVTAMSECVVAESEARAEILQKWEKVSDPAAEKCLKETRKAKRFPYSAMAKCLSTEAPAESKK